MDWFTLYHRFLIKYADVHYCKWKAENQHKAIENRDNPFDRGYSQPYWMKDMIDALKDENEERVKYLFMAESQYDPLMFECRRLVSAEVKL